MLERRSGKMIICLRGAKIPSGKTRREIEIKLESVVENQRGNGLINTRERDWET